MKPEEVCEEHRKYLKMGTNPRVSTAAVFKLLSDGMVDIKERLVRIETKQEVINDHTIKVTKRVDRLEGKFTVHCVEGAQSTGKIDERFKWQGRMQKLITTLIVFLIGLILTLEVGIGFPLP